MGTWSKAEGCSDCGHAAHVYDCPKPESIAKEQWQKMSDDERLDATRAARDGKLTPLKDLLPRAIEHLSGLKTERDAA